MGSRKRFDKNDVLKFLYGEMPPGEEQAFIEALSSDEELFELFSELKDGQDELVTAEVEPSDHSLDKVMQFASRSVTERRERRSFLRRGARFFTLNQAMSLSMFLLAILTVGIAFKGYEKVLAGPAMPEPVVSFDWEGSEIQSNLEDTRRKIDFILYDREAPAPLHNHTYRMVKTGAFAPEGQKVSLINLK